MRTALGVPRAVGAAGFVLVLAAGFLPHDAAQRASGTVQLPEHLAGYSYLTGDASASPPGRAVALYQHGFGVEFLDFPQAVVLGAGGDVYRRLDVAEDRAGGETQGDPAPMLLSPDGATVAVGDHDVQRPDLVLVDLATGHRTVEPLPAGRSVVPIAWSADSEQVAYLVSEDPTNPHLGEPIAGALGLLDVRSGRTTLLPAVGEVRAAAFSPDGTELAVQQVDSSGSLAVLGLDGGSLREIEALGDLAGPAAWSPDGRLLVTTTRASSSAPTGLSFAAASGQAGDVPRALPLDLVDSGSVLGWTDSAEVLVLLGRQDQDMQGGPESYRLSAVPVAGGASRQLTEMSGLRSYGVARFQLASATVTDLEVVTPTSIDRGTLPFLLRLGLALLVGWLAWLTARIVLRRLLPARRPSEPWDRRRTLSRYDLSSR